MTIDERSVTTALHTYARGLDVTDQDLDRIEAGLQERLHPTRHPSGPRRPWEWAVAACAVVALVLAVTALWRTRAEQAVPADPSITPADLAGAWLVDVAGDLWVWHLTADGRLAFSSSSNDYLDPPEQTTFRLEGEVLSFGGPDDVCRATLILPGDGRMTLTPVVGQPPCDMFGVGDNWPFIRVSPASVTGAAITARHDELRRATRDLEFVEEVTGTWLLKGSGTILAVVGTTTSEAAYVVDDDGDGQVDPDQRGTLVLRPDGGAVLRPTQGAEKGCDTVYARVVTTGAALEVEVSESSCGNVGANRGNSSTEPARGTWIKLN